ncbi:MAG: ribonuclease P protein component [Candidatus Saccharimonadales bacterium]
MVSKEHRFHGYNKLTTVYRKGQTSRTSLLSLKYYKNSRRTTYRLAVVVSRKVHKSAVVRNRIRRRIFELYRLNAPQFADQYDMIVTVFSEQIADTPATDLRNMVEKQLQQAGIVGPKTAAQHRKTSNDVV